MNRDRVRLASRSGLPVLGLLIVLAGASPARAFEAFASQLPCRVTATNSVGTVRPCISCHNNADGGSGCVEGMRCLNPFGTAFLAAGARWTMALALADSDGDGYTNGEELGDPAGTWNTSMAYPALCACASRPGFASYTPADADADADGYCCRGRNTNGDSDCRDPGEHDGSFDCNDAAPTVSSGATELCSNTIDNDCDGLPTLMDPDCADVVDRDGDGLCPMGRDNNRDRDCIDGAAEMSADRDCDDTQITVFPGARENCADGLDNDCNMAIDMSDSMCRGDVDNDMDGYCPIGRDTNGDGDCLDAGEDQSVSDCDDTNPMSSPAAVEQCTDGSDNDCDGLADFRDTECRSLFDEDTDGYCPTGRDGNGDGDCADSGEADGTTDCDDADPLVNPGAMEQCTDTVDEDCDGAVSLADSDCSTYLDGDGDRYCFVGFDMNRDGDCADASEASGNGDCDDARVAVNPAATEDCTNGVDDDCDGSTDALDPPVCNDYRDFDTDGWCTIGRDGNGDGDCADAGEVQDPNDAGHDDDPTVYPGAPENCLDGIDNDLDGMIDEAESCTRDVDADMDGYCPIGQDLDGDGDCLDMGENRAVSDCNDMDASYNPGAAELCEESRDRNCDGDIGLLDSDCFFLLDRDRDGFCYDGADDNTDGDCLDEGERRFMGAVLDCDDTNAAVRPTAVEDCTNGIDDDCDTRIDQADPSCPCSADADCDDSDPCSRDTCQAMLCVHAPDSTCGDGGTLDGGTGSGDSCNCRAPGAARGRSASPWALVLLLAVVWRRRNKRNC